jgi:hypothetical protein
MLKIVPLKLPLAFSFWFWFVPSFGLVEHTEEIVYRGVFGQFLTADAYCLLPRRPRIYKLLELKVRRRSECIPLSRVFSLEYSPKSKSKLSKKGIS